MTTDRLSPQDLSIRDFLETLDCSRSLAVWLLYREGEHHQLVNLAFNPEDYDTVEDVRSSLAATSFLAKASFLSTGIDTEKVALEKGEAAEKQCCQANARILSSRYDYSKTATILSMASRKIERVLGSFSPEEFVESCGFGPGASTSIRRRRASQSNKYAGSTDITPEAYTFVKDWWSHAFPLMGDYMFSIVPGSRVTVVPKNAKTDRMIAIEPDWNIFLQKGLGAMIRRRLRRNAGIDLNDQTVNQQGAWMALRLDLVTVDFSSASDTIALELVRELFPAPWLGLIEALRSSRTFVQGSWKRLHKVSSMGNGFTFELESLIFWALAQACADFTSSVKPVLVYGDDVILERKAYDVFLPVSTDCGFTVNQSKTFVEGRFRESCGEYFYDEVDVKPIYLREEMSDEFSFSKLANSIRLFSLRGGYTCNRRYRGVWERVRRYCPNVPRTPLQLGDAGLTVDFSELDKEPKPRKHGFEGWCIKARVSVSATVYTTSRGYLIHKIRMIGNAENETMIPNQDPVPGSDLYRIKTIEIPRWVDIGEWR